MTIRRHLGALALAAVAGLEPGCASSARPEEPTAAIGEAASPGWEAGWPSEYVQRRLVATLPATVQQCNSDPRFPCQFNPAGILWVDLSVDGDDPSSLIVTLEFFDSHVFVLDRANGDGAVAADGTFVIAAHRDWIHTHEHLTLLGALLPNERIRIDQLVVVSSDVVWNPPSRVVTTTTSVLAPLDLDLPARPLGCGQSCASVADCASAVCSNACCLP